MDYDETQFEPAVISAFTESVSIARRMKCSRIYPLHLLSALIKDSYGTINDTVGIEDLIWNAGGNFASLSSGCFAAMDKLPRNLTNALQPGFSAPFFRVLVKALYAKENMGILKVNIGAAMYGLTFDDSVASLLQNCDTSVAKIRRYILTLYAGKSPTSIDSIGALSKYSEDMIAQARACERISIIGRDDVVQKIVQILCMLKKPNLVLTGPPGIGKTSIVESLAYQIVHGGIHELEDVSLVALSTSRLQAGVRLVGVIEERVQEIISAVQASPRRVVMFIDEIHTVMKVGNDGSSVPLVEMLKPILTDRKLSIIGATTDKEFSKYFETNAAFARRFQRVHVSEPTVNETIEILRYSKDMYERHHGINIQDSALVAAVKLSDRFVKDRYFPDKALDVIDEAMSRQALSMSAACGFGGSAGNRKRPVDHGSMDKKSTLGDSYKASAGQTSRAVSDHTVAMFAVSFLRTFAASVEHCDYAMSKFMYSKSIPYFEKMAATVPKNEVTADHIAEIIEHRTGIPIQRLTKSGASSVLSLGERLRKIVIGQDHAIDTVSRFMLKSRAGLSCPTKPTGSFAFLGLTGTGKTELAKALCRDLFGVDKALVRFDMSEYTEKHQVARLIGSPPGYINSQDGGQLTEAVRKQLYSVVLFDEIEKAHPDVLNILLQILDDARLTDGLGRVADFSNCVVILTSNVGQEHLASAIHEPNIAAAREKVVAKFKQAVRPELVNRLDEIIVFNPLRPSALKRIVRLRVGEIEQRLADSNITIAIINRAIDVVLKESYDPLFGARPISRYLEQHVVSKLALQIVKGELKNDSHVIIGCQGFKLAISINPVVD